MILGAVMKNIKEKLIGKNFDSVKKRDDFVKNAISKLQNGATILDCGAGEQKYKKNCNNLKYKSQDFCQYDGNAIAGLDRNGSWDTSKIDIVSDIVNIPVGDHSFDAILCTEVLEHIKRPDLAIKEFSRILKKDGTLILTAPFASYTHMAPYHFCSGFDKYWYYEILKEYDFEIEVLEQNGNYYTELAVDLQRLPYLAKTYGHKINFLYKLILVFLIRKLYKFENDNSAEFRCNEYMIVARRI